MNRKKILNTDFIHVIEINPTELCNLKCLMCPRSEDYLNKNLHMPLHIHKRILENIENYVLETQNDITVSITGRGEPALYKHYRKMLKDYIGLQNKSNGKISILVNTNGYNLEKYEDLYKQIANMSINLYYNKTYENYEELKLKYKDRENITVHWRNASKDTSSKAPNELYYNNRSGSVNSEFVSNDKLKTNMCHKPFYNLFIDWNGDYNLCCNDWSHKKVYGNIMNESILDYYYKNVGLQEVKNMLLSNRRDISPCFTCNAKCDDDFIDEIKNI